MLGRLVRPGRDGFLSPCVIDRQHDVCVAITLLMLLLRFRSHDRFSRLADTNKAEKRRQTYPTFGSSSPTRVGFFVAILTPVSLQVAASEIKPLQVLSVGAPIVIYDTSRDACDKSDFPDQPARAFRDRKGLIHFFGLTSSNRALLGPDLTHLKHTCDMAFKGAKRGDPAAFDDNGWLTAFYATGDYVYALVHNELHGMESGDRCSPDGKIYCNEVSITAASSTDGGYHFARIPGDKGLVAVLPHAFRDSKHLPGMQFFGFSNPSNIIKNDRFYYAFVSQRDPQDGGQNAVCLLRTDAITDSAAWRAWDGSDFTISFVDPYTSSVNSPLAHICPSLVHGPPFFSLGSVSWSETRKRYLIVMRCQTWDRDRFAGASGAYLFETADLVNWSRPVLLLSDAQAGGIEQHYPSLIDENSADANFSTVTERPILFSMTGLPGGGTESWKIVARPIEIVK